MTTTYPQMLARFGLLSILMILIGAAPAAAETYKVDVTCTTAAGDSLSGWFIVDSATWAATDWDLKGLLGTDPAGFPSGASNPFEFTKTTSIYSFGLASGLRYLHWAHGPDGTDPQYQAFIYLDPALLASYDQCASIVTYGVWRDASRPGVGWHYNHYVGVGMEGIQVRAVAPVPLPPAALLLGSGLIPLVWARSRKRLGS